mgnify:CR=1 FL=1
MSSSAPPAAAATADEADNQTHAPTDVHVPGDEDPLPSEYNPMKSPSRRKLKQTFAATVAAAHILRKSRYNMPFGDLSMTVLMHACATGNSERVRQCLEGLREVAPGHG